MKQVLQDLRTGATQVVDAPAPHPGAQEVLIETRASLISPGTERMLVEFGKASLLKKARSQPERVKQVVEKMRADGVLPTLEAVFAKLDEPLPLGYCNAGEIVAVGSGVQDLRPGDRVVSNGPHAQLVVVPRNLCAKIPDGVSDEHAAFSVLASIALQSLRIAQCTLGERVVVYGLGLIGLTTVKLLTLQGCDVLGVDIAPPRLELARRLGAEVVDGRGGNVLPPVDAWTRGVGADAVIITASASGDQIVHEAAAMSRKRGRLVLVGAVDLNLRRSDFYDKELSFQVSCSYGPGRYDDQYEQLGNDYPLPYVRWTAGRNFDAILQLMNAGSLQVEEFITHRFALDEAPRAYEMISSTPECLAVVLEYPKIAVRERTVNMRTSVPRRPSATPRPSVALIGAGNFGKLVLAPALLKAGARLAYVCSQRGTAAAFVARKFTAAKATSDYREALADPDVTAVLIATQHHQHAEMVCAALEAGKHVFVEKPLAVDLAELRQVAGAAARHPDRLVMVGFNRRFSPHTEQVKRCLASRGEPLAMAMTINAGVIPASHWTQDPTRGGGRIVGEACHFIDLAAHIADADVETVTAQMMGPNAAVREDKMAITLGLTDGSVASINYFANGTKMYPKETIEIFSDGRILRLENFRSVRGYGFRGFRRYRSVLQDKGHREEIRAFLAAIAQGGHDVMPLSRLLNVTLASFAAVTSAREGRSVQIAREDEAMLLAEGGAVESDAECACA